MIATGRVAYANARIRALKSHLFDADTFRRLRSAAAGPGPSESDLPAQRFRHLLRCYSVVIDSYPTGQTLFRALYRLHEIENLKLTWRAHVRSRPFELWRWLWRPLGGLETVRLEECRDHTSLSDLVHGLRSTPYGSIADSILRAHPHDLVAAELAFDRWASASIAAAAASLERTESAARDLALSLVRERDLNLIRRGVHAFRLSPDAVVGSLVLLPRELPSGDLARLAAWTGDDGRVLLAARPSAWRTGVDRYADWDALVIAMRRSRREACRRAFLGSPYCLAPPLALLLLQEEEVRGVASILESGGRASDQALLERALAASAMGA